MITRHLPAYTNDVSEETKPIGIQTNGKWFSLSDTCASSNSHYVYSQPAAESLIILTDTQHTQLSHWHVVQALLNSEGL